MHFETFINRRHNGLCYLSISPPKDGTNSVLPCLRSFCFLILHFQIRKTREWIELKRINETSFWSQYFITQKVSEDIKGRLKLQSYTHLKVTCAAQSNSFNDFMPMQISKATYKTFIHLSSQQTSETGDAESQWLTQDHPGRSWLDLPGFSQLPTLNTILAFRSICCHYPRLKRLYKELSGHTSLRDSTEPQEFLLKTKPTAGSVIPKRNDDKDALWQTKGKMKITY